MFVTEIRIVNWNDIYNLDDTQKAFTMFHKLLINTFETRFPLQPKRKL